MNQPPNQNDNNEEIIDLDELFARAKKLVPSLPADEIIDEAIPEEGDPMPAFTPVAPVVSPQAKPEKELTMPGSNMDMALLYEKQHLYYEAYDIVRELDENRAHPAAAEATERVADKIFNTMSEEYEQRTVCIFSPQDLRRFLILPHQEYQKMLSVLGQDEVDEGLIVDEPAPEIADQPLTETVAPAPQTNIGAAGLDLSPLRLLDLGSCGLMDVSVAEFTKTMLARIGKKKKLGEISLTELIDLVRSLTGEEPLIKR